jgi:hypothetical protein
VEQAFMTHETNLHCEVFLNGPVLVRAEMLTWLVANAGCTVNGFFAINQVLEIEVRNNPRLKRMNASELASLRANTESAFVYSELILEIDPISNEVSRNDYVAELRTLLSQLCNGGFMVNICSEMETELK